MNPVETKKEVQYAAAIKKKYQRGKAVKVEVSNKIRNNERIIK